MFRRNHYLKFWGWKIQSPTLIKNPSTKLQKDAEVGKEK